MMLQGGGGNAAAAAAAAAAPSVVGSSGDGGGSSTTSGAHEGSSEAAGGGLLVGPLNEEDKGIIRIGDDADRGFGGHRWPRQETIALLKIRSDMDVAFRDASVKGPLWEEVSRKLAELGYNRNAKKCKEKFENVYKYHKRTKEGRTGKPDGKTYRFFDQLEALDTHPPPRILPHQQPQTKHQTASSMALMHNINPSTVTVPSTTATLPTISQTAVAAPTINLAPSNPTTLQSIAAQPPPAAPTTNPAGNPLTTNTPMSFANISMDLLSNSTSSSTSSDVELGGRRKRKRKWKDFFEGLMKEVIDKQEQLHRRFMEALEKREQERLVREEAWRIQEMARINREREILAQERAITAEKDAAVMAFLQKLSQRQAPSSQVQPLHNISIPQPQPQPTPQSQPDPQPSPAPPPSQLVPPPTSLPEPPVVQAPVTNVVETLKADNGDQNFLLASSSRWPKVEVEALIRLRTELDCKYQENGPKGPLWEDISAGMKKIGYNRNAKRCKEKWENINKYFKKVKESNKKRPEDSKTCPYFHQLEALYRAKNRLDHGSSAMNQIKPENSIPLMVRPEQQWPPPPPHPHHNSIMEDMNSEQMDHVHEEEDDKDGEEEDEEEDEEGGSYEMVPNKAVSVGSSE